MKKNLFMLFICALISQNPANAAEPHSLSVKTGTGKFIVDYTNGNNMDAKQTLNGPGTWSIPSQQARFDGVRENTNVSVDWLQESPSKKLMWYFSPLEKIRKKASP